MYPNQELSARKRVIDDDDRPALSARARKSPPEVIPYSIGSLRTIIHLTFSALAPHDHAPRYVHAHTIIQDDGGSGAP